tara:strand:- start:99 stop:704 length:606 start_codon:yes stop_codon:yes gene_type:complete
MSSIKLKHASGNSMSIEAPATNPASDLALKLPATVGTAGQAIINSSTAGTLEFGGVGKVLQVQYSQSQDNHTSTSSAYQNYNEINTTITPIAANSLLVAQVNLGCMRVYENNSHSAFAWVSLSDDAGSSYLFSNYHWAYVYDGDGISIAGLPAAATHVKVAGSTSARTYYVYTKLDQGDAYEINPASGDNIATLTIWEIAQ